MHAQYVEHNSCVCLNALEQDNSYRHLMLSCRLQFAHSSLLLFFWFLWPQIIWNTSCQSNKAVAESLHALFFRCIRKEEDKDVKRLEGNGGKKTQQIITHWWACLIHTGWRECVCVYTQCMRVLSSRVIEDGVRSVTPHRAPPAACQGWRLLPWDLWLSYPNCSQASKIKSPWDPFAWAGKPCTDNASQTPHWHFHGQFFSVFLHFSLFIFFILPVLWPLENFPNCFLLYPASLPVFFYYIFPPL